MSTLPPPALKTAIILLFKSAPPFVLYSEQPEALYEELKGVIRSVNMASPKLIEKQGHGPIKKVTFLDTELLGVSLQMGVVPQFPMTQA